MRNDGTVLTSERYNSSDEFSDGLFLVSGRNEWDYLDTKGQLALAVEDRFLVEPFAEGLAAAEDKNGKSGCIDKSGNTVIPHRFGVMSRPFSEGLAAVELDKSWHYIDQVGTIAVSPALDGHPILLAGDFHSGLALIVPANRELAERVYRQVRNLGYSASVAYRGFPMAAPRVSVVPSSIVDAFACHRNSRMWMASLKVYGTVLNNGRRARFTVRRCVGRSPWFMAAL